MTERFVTHDEAIEVLGDPAIAFAAIGVLADRAVRAFSDRARPGPGRKLLTVKMDGNDTAAYWVEGVAHWAAAHPEAKVVTMRVGDYGWPEFIVDDRVHLRVERVHRPGASARRMSRQRQGPDAHRVHMTLFALDEQPVGAPSAVTNVDLTAAFGPNGLIEGATISAPFGDHLLWDWDISQEEVARCIARWRSIGHTPWLDYIDTLAMMEIRVPQDASPLTAVPLPATGRRFAATENTKSPTDAGLAADEQARREAAPGGDASN